MSVDNLSPRLRPRIGGNILNGRGSVGGDLSLDFQPFYGQAPPLSKHHYLNRLFLHRQFYCAKWVLVCFVQCCASLGAQLCTFLLQKDSHSLSCSLECLFFHLGTP